MSEDHIKIVHMHQSGPIPGVVGWFSGGQTITINTDTMEVVDQTPLAQRAYDASPLVEPDQEEEVPAQPEPTPEAVQPELVPTSEPALSETTPEAQPEQAPEQPTTEQAVDATPATEGVI